MDKNGMLCALLALLTISFSQLNAYSSPTEEADSIEVPESPRLTRAHLPVYLPAGQAQGDQPELGSGEETTPNTSVETVMPFTTDTVESTMSEFATTSEDLPANRRSFISKSYVVSPVGTDSTGSSMSSHFGKLSRSTVESNTLSTVVPLEKTTPLFKTPSTQSANSDGEQLPTLQSVLSLISNQQQVLVGLKEHLSHVTSRLDAQQAAIDRHEQLLDEHSLKMSEVAHKQIQTSNDLYSLNSAINSHEHKPTSTGSDDHSKKNTNKLVSLSDDVHSIDVRISRVEEMQTSLASVLQHLISEKVWDRGYSNSSINQPDYGYQPTSANDSDSGLSVQPISEADAQEVEERTNELLSSVENWNKVEQILHTSLSDLHTDHRRYDEAIAFLTNYTLNNAVIISQLAQARVDDGGSIMILMNSSTWLSQQVYLMKAAVRRNKNLTEELMYQTEQNLDQLLELIQLNSLKIITLQDALTHQGSLYESHLNYTTSQLFHLERSLASLGFTHNSSLSIVTDKLQSNKEKSDMLWSRFRILDNRLAHVEVKYLTEELNKYQKSNDDLRQSLKLMEIENQLETITTNIDIQQTNHESIFKKLNSAQDKLDTLSSSVSNMQSEWTEFSDSLPKLDLMYNEVQMMINVLPTDCDDVYKRGIHNSGPQLVKPASNHSALKVLCDIDSVNERGWTVVQQRLNGEEDFNRNWTEYREGFGQVDFDKEFWAGNELLHTLTSKYNYTIKFDMWTTDNTYVYAIYDTFQLLSETEGYRLHISGYSGNATDSLKHSNATSFSTIDVDNDMSSTNCAHFYTAGWWYKHCHYCNLNGRYTVGVVWFDHLTDDWMELNQTSIKISRRK